MALRPVASTSKHVFKYASSPAIVTCRHHSSSAKPPVFSPSGSTSAHTEIPYGDADHASSAYLPRNPKEAGSTASASVDETATRSTPDDLTPKQRRLLEEIVRVDQAGELGANYIYQGQHAVLKRRRDKRVADIVQVRSGFLRTPRRSG